MRHAGPDLGDELMRERRGRIGFNVPLSAPF